MSAPASSMPADLIDGRVGVRGQRVGHGLDGDRRIAADLDLADADLPRPPPLDPPPGADVVQVGRARRPCAVKSFRA